MIRTALCVCALVLAACTSTISGRPSLRTPVPAPASGDTVGSGSAVSGTASSTTDLQTRGAEQPSGSAGQPSGSAGQPGGCVPGADYCDTFVDPHSGWPQESPSHFYARYDSYNGGSYAMGERTNAAISEDAPYDITRAAADYSVQLDVDAAPGQGFGAADELGFACWEHAIPGGDGITSAFLLELSESQATVGLWDGTDGSYHEITSAAAPGALSPTGWTHLTARCLLGSAGGSTQARLSLAVNGSEVVSTVYDKSVNTYDWDVGNRVGLLAVGPSSNVYYDNFAITGKCTSAVC
jgi:hypothetical protein